MSKHYVGEVGTVITVDCNETITGATSTTINVLKPDGTTAEWSASIYGTQYLRCVTESTDFSVAGKYYAQASFTLGSWTGLGDTATFTIYPAYG